MSRQRNVEPGPKYTERSGLYNRARAGHTEGVREVNQMENTHVICDVCGCVYNEGGHACNLTEIKITEQCKNCAGGVDNPHYCQSYEKR